MAAQVRKSLFLGGAIVLIALVSCLLLAGTARAQEDDGFEHPDHIVVDIHAERYPLGPDRRPDTAKPKYSTVVAKFRIFKDRGELVECGYPGKESQFAVNVAPSADSDRWSFSFSLPANEPGGIGNRMSYSLSEIPWPGFSSELETDGNGVFNFTNKRKLGEVSWGKVDSETSDPIGGSEWLITGADGFSMSVVDNGENDEDPAVGALKVAGLKWGVRRATGTLWGAYELSEAKAPEGYELADRSYRFEINESTDFASPVPIGPIENDRTLGEVSWGKVDSETSDPIGGSEWLITGADGFSMSVVDNGENDEDPAVGALKVAGLKWGAYELSEEKAPKGYDLNADPRPFEIGGSRTSIDLGPVENRKVPEKPGKPTDSKTDGSRLPAKDIKLARTGDDLVLPTVACALLLASLLALAAHRACRSAASMS